MTQMKGATTMYETLTKDEMEEIEGINAENKWGFSLPEILRLIADYIDANDKCDTHAKERIEYRLEDCNFHTLCKHLHDGNFDFAMAEMYNTFVY